MLGVTEIEIGKGDMAYDALRIIIANLPTCQLRDPHEVKGTP